MSFDLQPFRWWDTMINIGIGILVAVIVGVVTYALYLLWQR